MTLVKSRWLGFLAAGIAGLIVGVGMSVHAGRGPETQLPIEDIRNISQVIDHIKRAYVEEVDDSELLENAIHGMLTGLDPHSTYLTPDDFKDLREDTSGKFGGLGIEVAMDETGYVKVVTPIDDTPAYRAGVEAGDLVIQLDSKPVKGMTLMQAVEIMRGEPGSDILLTILRDGENKPLEITITRDVIKVTSIRKRMIEDGYGYIRISQFQERTGKDFVTALKELREENESELDGLVLDLRNNPGGVLQASVEVVDAMVTDGVIVYTEGRLPNSEIRFNATSSNPSEDLNIVVLINGGSASASEIVAGALQDHKRALIMGTESFGKGSVQTILPLGEKRALKLTTARYFTPSGRSIQAQGIKPDIVVERATLTRQKGLNYYKEADLSGHLENPNGEEEATKESADDEQAAETVSSDKDDDDDLAVSDYQLYEALNILKGMTIVKGLN